MDGKEAKIKMWKKIGFGILFVAACFAAMYILIEFSDTVLYVVLAAVLLLVTAFLFLDAIFSDRAKKWMPEEEKEEAPVTVGTDGEFHLKIVKHMKEMESTQKELIEVLKNQNTIFRTQIESIENAIYMLSEKQENQTKSIIKYNKENARQLAISERETLEYIMSELKGAIENNAGAGVVRETFTKTAEEPLFVEEPVIMPVLEEVSEEELFEVSDLVGDDEIVMPEEVQAVTPEAPPEEILEEPLQEELSEIPELPEDFDITELFDIPELNDIPAEEPAEEPVTETVTEEPVAVAEEPKQEETALNNPLAGLAGGDPNAMMTPEDIAKLLEAMGQ